MEKTLEDLRGKVVRRTLTERHGDGNNQGLMLITTEDGVILRIEWVNGIITTAVIE